MRAIAYLTITVVSIFLTAVLMVGLGVVGFFMGAGLMFLAVWLSRPKKPMPEKEDRFLIKAEVFKWSERVWDSDKDGFVKIVCYKLVLRDETERQIEYVYELNCSTHCGDPLVKECFDMLKEKI